MVLLLWRLTASCLSVPIWWSRLKEGVKHHYLVGAVFVSLAVAACVTYLCHVSAMFPINVEKVYANIFLTVSCILIRFLTCSN